MKRNISKIQVTTEVPEREGVLNIDPSEKVFKTILKGKVETLGGAGGTENVSLIGTKSDRLKIIPKNGMTFILTEPEKIVSDFLHFKFDKNLIDEMIDTYYEEIWDEETEEFYPGILLYGESEPELFLYKRNNNEYYFKLTDWTYFAKFKLDFADNKIIEILPTGQTGKILNTIYISPEATLYSSEGETITSRFPNIKENLEAFYGKTNANKYVSVYYGNNNLWIQNISPIITGTEEDKNNTVGNFKGQKFIVLGTEYSPAIPTLYKGIKLNYNKVLTWIMDENVCDRVEQEIDIIRTFKHCKDKMLQMSAIYLGENNLGDFAEMFDIPENSIIIAPLVSENDFLNLEYMVMFLSLIVTPDNNVYIIEIGTLNMSTGAIQFKKTDITSPTIKIFAPNPSKVMVEVMPEMASMGQPKLTIPDTCYDIVGKEEIILGKEEVLESYEKEYVWENNKWLPLEFEVPIDYFLNRELDTLIYLNDLGISPEDLDYYIEKGIPMKLLISWRRYEEYGPMFICPLYVQSHSKTITEDEIVWSWKITVDIYDVEKNINVPTNYYIKATKWSSSEPQIKIPKGIYNPIELFL